jgi:3,4-dihydroxy 2-butanone 4-phosphate synthase / GTP cyclohydrolase II
MSQLREAIERLKGGKPIILVDDEGRENEGDLILAAQFATPQEINFMAAYGRGLICLALEPAIVDRLGLALMVPDNHSERKTAFTLSIEARHGVTTGISAFDRAKTIQAAVSDTASAQDIISPGHIFPLRAAQGGVLARDGHTEGSVDLMRIAGLKPAAVICEIMSENGDMARMPELRSFAKKHDMPMLSIRDIIAHRMKHEELVKEIASAQMPNIYAKTVLKVHAFQSLIDGREHLALTKGEASEGAVVRIHSECLTGDALGSLRCDCGAQLQAALERIGSANSGAVVYVTGHEGRGVGLANKIRAYALQDQGADTVAANTALGFGEDERDYGVAAQILRALSLNKIRLLTNNPHKVSDLKRYGIDVIEQLPLIVPPNPYNQAYLAAKRDKLGHQLFWPHPAA